MSSKRFLITITLFSWVVGGLASCAIQPTKIAVSLAQAPLADSLLVEYIEDDVRIYESIGVQLKRMRLLYDDMEQASKSAETFPAWLEDNWFRVVGAVQDWNFVVYFLEQHAKETKKPVPDGLLIFKANVEAGFNIGIGRARNKFWQDAGVEIIRTLAMLVATKNGVSIGS